MTLISHTLQQAFTEQEMKLRLDPYQKSKEHYPFFVPLCAYRIFIKLYHGLIDNQNFKHIAENT
ncbi:CLUMA_CG015562, isoform A [Clunio marinus]|uniref:CLUMA_CG015562, isoform A n=1 Tax=Clunio marinus TaxID=568069 RepID=A0A1J1IUR4_9DIPT|nr:CLUMA_CG015562, isoform A [Clunio marinus]